MPHEGNLPHCWEPHGPAVRGMRFERMDREKTVLLTPEEQALPCSRSLRSRELRCAGCDFSALVRSAHEDPTGADRESAAVSRRGSPGSVT